MRSHGIALLVGLAAVLPLHAEAQAPGYQQLDPRSVRAEYTAEVLDRINDIYEQWAQAWSQDSLDELVALYWEDAIIVPRGGTPLRGADQIRAFLETTLPEHGQVEAFMVDFDASGGMAQVFGNYMIQVRSGSAAGETQTGPILTIYAQRSRKWRIRSQVFIAN